MCFNQNRLARLYSPDGFSLFDRRFSVIRIFIRLGGSHSNESGGSKMAFFVTLSHRGPFPAIGSMDRHRHRYRGMFDH